MWYTDMEFDVSFGSWSYWFSMALFSHRRLPMDNFEISLPLQVIKPFINFTECEGRKKPTYENSQKRVISVEI